MFKVDNIKNFKGGWYCGLFHPSIIFTNEFELGLHKLKKGEKTFPHKHLRTVEVNLIVSGKLIANGKELGEGDIFIYEVGDCSNVEVLEDTTLVVARNGSFPGDKIFCE